MVETRNRGRVRPVPRYSTKELLAISSITAEVLTETIETLAGTDRTQSADFQRTSMELVQPYLEDGGRIDISAPHYKLGPRNVRRIKDAIREGLGAEDFTNKRVTVAEGGK